MRSKVYNSARLGLLLLSGLAAAFTLRVSVYRFGGFDLAPLIDSGWRVVSGQVPGRDFVNTVPASLYLFVAFLFRHLGVNWRALGLGAVLLFGVYTLLGFRVSGLLSTTLGRSKALLVCCIYVAA